MKDIVIKSVVTSCPCPRCGAQMDGAAVVCWACYRSTDRLSATVVRADVIEWEQARQKRQGWATS